MVAEQIVHRQADFPPSKAVAKLEVRGGVSRNSRTERIRLIVVHDLTRNRGQRAGNLRRPGDIPREPRIQLVLRDQRNLLSGNVQIGADRKRASGEYAFQKLRVGVCVSRFQAKLPGRLPGAVELHSLAARRRQIRVACSRRERVKMYLVPDFSTEDRCTQRMSRHTPLGASLLRERVLRPQNLELRIEESIVLIDFVDVDEAEAPARSPEDRPRLGNGVSQSEFPRMLALRLAYFRCGSVEKEARRSGIGHVVGGIANALGSPAQRHPGRARNINEVLQVESLAVL